MTCLLISAGILLLRVYDSYDKLWPYIGDVLFRIYAFIIIRSIHHKYAEIEKEKLENVEIKSIALSEEFSTAETHQPTATTSPQNQSIFDRYAEIGALAFAGINLIAGIVAMPYYLYCVFTAYIHFGHLKDSLAMLSIATMTTILALILFVGISQVRLSGIFAMAWIFS